jgi:uncharacterized protein
VSSTTAVGYRIRMPTLARISVTPVKGTALLHPRSVRLTRAGIPQDRRFFFVDEWGELISGDAIGSLVRIRAAYDPSTERLSLRFPDGEELSGAADALDGAQTVNFHGRAVPAHAVDGPFSEAVSSFSSKSLRLMRCDHDGDGADVEPITLVSFESVRDLAARGRHAGELDGRRFRMNLELEGCAPYEEDGWDGLRVRVGEATIEVGSQVPRCVFTTKSPETGDKDWDTLTQIAKYRPRIPGGGGLPFGVYARVVEPGTASIGDAVTPLPDAP